MQHLDGNVLAGPLAGLFGFDATMASARCAGCGHVAVLAAAMVWADAMGYVVRCADCDSVLATVVEGDDRAWISLSGISALEVPRG
jgi:phage FluMu protein Com